MAKREGWEIKVVVNGAPFKVKRCERDDTCADLNVSDSEGGVFEQHEGGQRVARITMENATYDDTDNPFAPPFSLSSRQHAAVEIFWAGMGADSDNFPDVLITSGKISNDVTALEPCSFSGVSNGGYTLAGE